MKGRKPRPVPASKPSASPEPPPELTEDALAEWNRVSGELSGRGLLTGVDRAALAAYCDAYGMWAWAKRAIAKIAAADPETGGLLIKTKHGNVIQHALVGIANKAAEAMVRYAAEFGMTPSARGKVRMKDAPAEPVGKKEQANLVALTAAEGTGWGDLVH